MGSKERCQQPQDGATFDQVRAGVATAGLLTDEDLVVVLLAARRAQEFSCKCVRTTRCSRCAVAVMAALHRRRTCRRRRYRSPIVALQKRMMVCLLSLLSRAWLAPLAAAAPLILSELR